MSSLFFFFVEELEPRCPAKRLQEALSSRRAFESLYLVRCSAWGYSILLELVKKKRSYVFVWPWNDNARTKQKQQTKGNRAIWLVCRADTNVRGFWLVKRTLGWKNFLGHFHISHNALCLRAFCPQHTQTVLHTQCLHLVLGLSIVPREM